MGTKTEGAGTRKGYLEQNDFPRARYGDLTSCWDSQQLDRTARSITVTSVHFFFRTLMLLLGSIDMIPIGQDGTTVHIDLTMCSRSIGLRMLSTTMKYL